MTVRSMSVATRRPAQPVPEDHRPPHTVPYHVHDGDTLATIAAAHHLGWEELARLNWNTTDPAEINWYLYNRLGCRDVSGLNYIFTSATDPGILFVPEEAPVAAAEVEPEPSRGGRIAREKVNVLKLPVVRLPIGSKVKTTKKTTRYRLRIPTAAGGTLTLAFLGDGKVDLRSSTDQVLEQAAKVVSHEIPAGGQGFYEVLAEGEVGAEVQCYFEQTGCSREQPAKDAAPFFPWNFYFWPTARRLKIGNAPEYDNPVVPQTQDVLRRQARALGRPADADPAAAWEWDYHGSPAVGQGWEGHCHNAAPASILFDEPHGQTAGGEHFTKHELKLLATEYFGNFGLVQREWVLGAGALLRGFYLPYYLRPGDPPTRERLKNALLEQGFPAVEAEALTVGAVATLGGDANFPTNMRAWFGELAAKYFKALVELVRTQGHALLSNTRDYRGDSVVQVWNQAVFHYSAVFQEHSQTQDDHDMWIWCNVYANWDGNPSNDLPAQLANGVVQPVVNRSLVFKHIWRLQFDDAGAIVLQNPRNGWHSLTNGAGKELYAPSDLFIATKCAAARLNRPAFGGGNPYVKADLVDRNLVSIRARYR